MARIRCRYEDCIFLDGGFCSAPAVELDPDTGCITYRTPGEAGKDDDRIYEDELLDDWDLEDLGISDLLDDEWDANDL
jgi:hypothetical protein